MKIDGEDIREIKLESLRRMMGVVSQEIILFNDTVKQNIAYGQEGIKDSNIISYCIIE